ncbi:MAG: hypothetical protein ABSA57_17800 [Candidatus Acidiferrales bacterium]
MKADPVVIVAQNETEHNLKGHAADRARNIDTFISLGRQLPSPKESRIDGCNQSNQGADGFMGERWVYHSPLPLPDVPLADHEAVTQEQGDAYDVLTLYVVLPVLNQHMVGKLDVLDRVHAGPIHGGLEDVAEDSELSTHPVQEVVSGFIFLLRAGRCASVFDFHICALSQVCL